MKQLKNISQLKSIFPKIKGIKVALLYGSFGRNEASPNSDIDIQLLVNQDFEIQNLKSALEKAFQDEIFSIHEIALRNKLVVYFKAQPKMELAICKDLSEIDRNYIGSEIKEVERTILYVKTPNSFEIRSYLSNLITNKSSKISEKQITELIDKFLYEFENCSTMQRRSDGYQFYYFYNIALHVAVQLNYLSRGHYKFNFLPKYFIASILGREEQKPFYDLKGTLFLPEANQQKRKLLDFFYTGIEKLVNTEKLTEIKCFCEWIYERDFFWNFRDVSTHNPKIKSGIIFRTATLTFFQNEDRFDDLLNSKNIKTVIDLRAENEIVESPYSTQSLSNFNYIKASLDPWNQPDWFIEKHHQGTNEEIAYRFFALACKSEIKTIIETIINEQNGAVAIHCFAGKDRTGIIISLLHLLVETPLETIYADYLASEVDVKLHRLKIVLDIINQMSGIEPYLMDCGITENQISQLKQKLLK
jgi:protein tyrosine/serine phosphatase/predicted nucleotidyltransferase